MKPTHAYLDLVHIIAFYIFLNLSHVNFRKLVKYNLTDLENHIQGELIFNYWLADTLTFKLLNF
ncbi:MAG: hypothetical protein ACI93R_004228 [Flavobacteriales bacterium]|jgi:hypothetical protein